MKILCIGGPVDGRRTEIDDEARHYQIYSGGVGEEWTEVYHWTYMAVGGVNLFHHHSITKQECVQLLLDKYPQEIKR